MVRNRNLVLIGSLIVQLCLGGLYAWSVFVNPLKEHGLTTTQTQLIFSATILSFAFVMVFAGRLQDRIGPRKVAAAGGVVLGIGYILAAQNLTFLWLLLSIGLIGGAGLGLAYMCPIASCMKWFPDKKGFVTGIAVAGFGGGALILSWFGPTLIATRGVQNTFLLLGIAYLSIVGAAATLLENPPKDYKPNGWKPKKRAAHAKKEEHDWHEMIKTKEFWVMWLTYILSASAGLMVIGNLKPYGTSSGLSDVVAASAVGVLAIFNAFGRIAWGFISDRIGRTKAILILASIQAAMMLAVIKMGSSEMLIYLGAALIGFNYGGNFALFPSATADFFGTKNLGVNYGLLFTAFGIAGVIGPILGGSVFDAFGSYMYAFIAASVMCIIAAGLSLLVKNPYHN